MLLYRSDTNKFFLLIGMYSIYNTVDSVEFKGTDSLKQQSAGRHVAPLGHILIPCQPVFANHSLNMLNKYVCFMDGYMIEYYILFF
jgi:hypothetical protein